ncbi:hypothetical protein AU192_16400, partial [Mycobacterium numidiamassiliense]
VSNPIEDYVQGQSGLMWRRAIWRDQIDWYLTWEHLSEDEPDGAANYVSIYRWATDNEMIRFRLPHPALMVVAFMSNLELARHMM